MPRLLLVSVLVGLVGCGPPRPDRDDILPEFDHAQIGYTGLAGRRLVDGDFIGFPTGLLVVGDYWVIADYPKGGSAIHIVDRRTGRLALSVGGEGGGPGEFMGSPNLIRDPQDVDMFWAYDPNASRLTEFSLTGLLEGRDRPETVVNIAAPRIMYALKFLEGGCLVGLGLAGQGRIAVLDTAGPAVEFFGPLPGGEDGVPRSVVQHAYQSQMALDPERQRIVLAWWRGGSFEVFRVDGQLVRTFDGPFPFVPDYTVDEGPRGPIMRAGWENRYGYLDVGATDSSIVALFSGRSEAHFRSDAWIGEYIHVFTWQGELTAVYRLDRAVHNIALSPLADVMYAAVEVDPESGGPAVIEYDLEAD